MPLSLRRGVYTLRWRLSCRQALLCPSVAELCRPEYNLPYSPFRSGARMKGEGYRILNIK